MKRAGLLFLITIASVILMCSKSLAQDYHFKNQRAEEDYSYLRDSTDLQGWDAIKFIPFSKQRTSYLSLGGSLRPRYEINTNQQWISGNSLDYYSQRAGLHADVHLGNNFRLFGELQSGLTSAGDVVPQVDDLGVHQIFAEYMTSDAKFAIKLGRQELQYGTGRLFDISVGPNVRRSFDLIKASLKDKNYRIDLFYGNVVNVNFGFFDNQSNFFNGEPTNKVTWGAYGQFSILANQHDEFNTEIYYIGLDAPQARYNDVQGSEVRHTVGLRRFGTAWNGFTHNHELIIQLGTIGDNAITAFNFEANWNYQMMNTKWKPIIGLKLDWSSGDREAGDGEVNSFNPLFVNPAIYNLAVVSTPVNLFSLHPSITIFPSKKLMIQLEYALFYRSSSADGIYSPSNRLNIMAGQLDNKHIGNTIGLLLLYRHNARINFSIRSSYYRGGEFVNSMGLASYIFQFSPTLEYKF